MKRAAGAFGMSAAPAARQHREPTPLQAYETVGLTEARMARISYDDQTAAAYKAVREVRRDGLVAWREAVQRYLRPSARMSVVDIGAGTGAFAAAFNDWFDLAVIAVEPSAAMR